MIPHNAVESSRSSTKDGKLLAAPRDRVGMALTAMLIDLALIPVSQCVP
jgi:hypothetical protein